MFPPSTRPIFIPFLVYPQYIPLLAQPLPIPLLTSPLCISLAVLGADHPKTLASMNNLAHVLDQLGKYDEAASLYEELIPKMKEIVGDSDPRTRAAVENYHLFCAKKVGINST